ncbi:MAG: FAD-dependent monooxygenase [Alphaproteobacteria bacterium]|nr:FAD-dependent monooxygenase [Alphaproteobacteria bacterium]
MFDPILRRWVETMPAARLRYHTELLSFEDRGSGVIATLRGPDGAEEEVAAAYLVGADGGSSTVRQLMGIAMSGQPVLTYTTNVIFRCSNFWDLHDKKKGYRFIFIGPEGTWGTIVAIDGYDRFRFSVVGDETKRTLSEDEVRALIVRAMGKGFDFEILSIVPWVRRELVADTYGRGRVFLAGDAVHLNSPTGAFGMNTGMQDAGDLGWKLAAVLQGWGGANLLATYETERRPVALRNIKEAGENLRRMISPRQALSPLVFQPGPQGDAARKTFGDAYTRMMKYEWFTLNIHLGYRYDGSPIIVDDGTPAPDDPPMAYTQTARPGGRAPHVWLAPGKSTLDRFGRGFVLLRFDRRASTDAIEASARARAVPLEVIDIDNDEARRLYTARLVLVRPDGFVAWRGEATPTDDRFIDRVRGAAAANAARAAEPQPAVG